MQLGEDKDCESSCFITSFVRIPERFTEYTSGRSLRYSRVTFIVVDAIGDRHVSELEFGSLAASATFEEKNIEIYVALERVVIVRGASATYGSGSARVVVLRSSV